MHCHAQPFDALGQVFQFLFHAYQQVSGNDHGEAVLSSLAGFACSYSVDAISSRKVHCFNHYPDFIVMLQSGRLLLVETKEEYLDNLDNQRKLKLGCAWKTKQGSVSVFYGVRSKMSE